MIPELRMIDEVPPDLWNVRRQSELRRTYGEKEEQLGRRQASDVRSVIVDGKSKFILIVQNYLTIA
jgi:hypothetical protein